MHIRIWIYVYLNFSIIHSLVIFILKKSRHMAQFNSQNKGDRTLLCYC